MDHIHLSLILFVPIEIRNGEAIGSIRLTNLGSTSFQRRLKGFQSQPLSFIYVAEEEAHTVGSRFCTEETDACVDCPVND